MSVMRASSAFCRRRHSRRTRKAPTRQPMQVQAVFSCQLSFSVVRPGRGGQMIPLPCIERQQLLFYSRLRRPRPKSRSYEFPCPVYRIPVCFSSPPGMAQITNFLQRRCANASKGPQHAPESARPGTGRPAAPGRCRTAAFYQKTSQHLFRAKAQRQQFAQRHFPPVVFAFRHDDP